MRTHEEWECSVCGTTTAFERPDCLDGHGDDCPDAMCSRCGAVVVLGGVLDGGHAAA